MKLTILLISLLLLPVACRADSILASNCSVTPALCSFQAKTLAYLDLHGGGDSMYETPVPGAQYDSNSVTGSHTIPGVPFVFTGTATGTVSDSFSGIHTYLSATGSIFCGTGPGATCPFGDSASAIEFGSIVDAFATDSSVPGGTRLQITYTLDATGDTGHDATGSLDSTVETSLELGGNAISPTCTAGYFAFHFSGTYATTCVASIPIESNELIPVILELDASASANDTAAMAFLDASNTAKITGVILTDSNGNPLSGVALYDASGFDYNQPAVTTSSVPEPSSLMLLGSGLVSAAGLVRRRLNSGAARAGGPSVREADGWERGR